MLLIRGACIDDDAMFSGESTPLLKESIEPWEADACLDVGGAHKTAVLFGGTNDVFIVLIYIYILSIIFYFVHWCAHTQPLARRGQLTVALVHYGRERRAVGGAAHRSACMARVLHLAH